MIFKRNKITKKSIKQALDNLPMGIACFNKSGALVLCNRQMYNTAYSLLQRDLQYEKELAEALEPLTDSIFTAPDDRVWHFVVSNAVDDEGMEFTFYLAADATELYKKTQEFRQKNNELTDLIANMEQISKNVVAIAREEELLSLKMQVHANMGKSVLETHKFYQNGCDSAEKSELISHLKNTLSVLSGEIGQSDSSEPLEDLLDTARTIGASVVIDGEMPKNYNQLRLIVSAMRECLTNLIRHAKGDTLFVHIEQKNGLVRAEITNNGVVPKEEIVEGGGLNSLRISIEKSGGILRIESFPKFRMIVTINSDQ